MYGSGICTNGIQVCVCMHEECTWCCSLRAVVDSLRVMLAEMGYIILLLTFYKGTVFVSVLK